MDKAAEATALVRRRRPELPVDMGGTSTDVALIHKLTPRISHDNQIDAYPLQVPQLETAAQADERGGVDTVIAHAAAVASSPSVDIHAFRYDAGRQQLELIGKGSFVIFGVVPQTVTLNKRDAHR